MAKQVGARKLQILETLAELLEQTHSEKITTALLASKLACSEAALYRHFASKAQMYEELIAGVESQIDAIIEKQKQHDTGLLQVEMILQGMLRFSQRNRGLSRILIGEALVYEHERLQQRVNQLILRIENALEDALKIAAVQENLKPDADLKALANLLGSYLCGRWANYVHSHFKHAPLAHWQQQWPMLYFACLSQSGLPGSGTISD